MKFKPKKLIYLANSYTSKDLDKDFARTVQAKRRIRESFVGGKLKKLYDVTLILPIAISASMADLCDFDTGFDTWAGDDYTFISKCDEVWVLVSEGWDKSYGVREEIKFALERNILVKYVNENTFEITDMPFVGFTDDQKIM